ncbi:helicase-related protein [Calidithermus chliarophilus]|uniref:helicase-related protein n=1 Tax=Calidithermus chliarophilus TaxID=52023 RepID=UPI0003FF4D6F|nr:helicase-related protein [Calidithermus chliarophilus]
MGLRLPLHPRLYHREALRFARERRLPPGDHLVCVRPLAPLVGLFRKSYWKDDPNVRWITLHPHGDEHYVRVPIRVNADGTAHVIGGGKGLRGLKLDRLKGPEEWGKGKKAKPKDKPEGQDKPKGEHDRQLEENAAQLSAALSAQLAERRRRQIEAAARLGLAGWDDPTVGKLADPGGDEATRKEYLARAARALGIDPAAVDAAPLKGGAGMVRAADLRKVASGLRRIEGGLLRELAHNHELRQEVIGEQPVGAEHAVDTRPSVGLGFRRATRRMAEERGLDRAQVKRQAREVFNERVAHLMESDPEKAARVVNAAETARAMHDVARVLREQGGSVQVDSELDPAALKERAEAVREFLKAAQEAKLLEAQLRELDPRRQRDPERLAKALKAASVPAMRVDAHVLDDEDFIAQLEADVGELAKADLTKHFLDKVEAAGGEGGIEAARAKMHGAHAHGAHAHLQSALMVAGGMGMDRMVAEVLGLEAAAQIAARAILAAADPEELEAVREGLQRYHDEESVKLIREATERAEQAEAGAAAIELPDISDAASLAAAQELNALRKGMLEEALHHLGTALGQLEAGAALNLALRQAPRGDLRLEFGKTPTDKVLWGLGALGLEKDKDFSIERDPDTNALGVTLSEAAVSRLVSRPSAQEAILQNHLEAIKRGDLDEEDWLPAGFVSYPLSLHNDPARPKPFAAPPGFAQGRPVAEALGEYVASRLADGWKPSDILAEVGSVDFVIQHVPEAQQEAYADALEELFPTTDAKGELRNVDADPELRARFEAMAREYVGSKHPGEADLHSQSIDPDAQETRRAAFAALMQDPRTQAAFKPVGELGDADQRALRNYFYTEIAQVDPKSGKDRAAYEAALKELGPEPQKMSVNLFGDEDISPEWEQWNRRRQEIVEQFAGPSAWAEFVSGMRGLDKAYRAVQEHMRSAFAQRFQRYHANLTGKPLRLGKQAIPLGERFKAATDPEERRKLLEQEQAQMAALRDRRAGKFAAEGEGAVKEKLNRALEMKEKLRQAQGALFMGLGAQGFEGKRGIELNDPFRERLTLGQRAEGEIAAILPYLTHSTDPNSQGVRLRPGLSMGAGTKFVRQQRAIKFAVAAKKTYQALGMGSGKTAIQIGTFTELHARGKARRGLFVVPSVVRNQFGEEMARFTEPGRYKFHAADAPFEERLAAYRDPHTHMVVTTHQTFRDDLVRLMAEHQGVGAGELEARFAAARPRERRRMLREALEHHGVADLLDYLTIDEGHNLSNRDGKPDALMAMVADAALAESRHAMMASGTPAKNDESEVFDILSKLDPERWGERKEEFKRNYGVSLPVAQDAFKRAAGRYIYAASVGSGVARREVWGREGEGGVQAPLELHPEQRKALEQVNQAYQRARAAQRTGGVDVEALRTLSPSSFAGKPPEEHEAIARKLQQNLGTLRFAAQSRVIDAAPAAHNAKVQHVLALAEAKRRAGHPGVVFAHSLEAVEQISAALKAAGHRVEVVTGADSSEQKAAKRQKFHPDSGEPQADILVMSDAGAVGMNLQRGRWLANYDLPLTHATHAQRNARIDRIGQTQDVEIHNLVTDTKFDRDAVARLQRKSLLQQVFEGDWENLDDSGMARYIALARAARAKTPEELAA